MVMDGLNPGLNEQNTNGRMVRGGGHDKNNLNMYSSNHGDLPRSSSDKDVHHKRIRMMGT